MPPTIQSFDVDLTQDRELRSRRETVERMFYLTPTGDRVRLSKELVPNIGKLEEELRSMLVRFGMENQLHSLQMFHLLSFNIGVWLGCDGSEPEQNQAQAHNANTLQATLIQGLLFGRRLQVVMNNAARLAQTPPEGQA